MYLEVKWRKIHAPGFAGKNYSQFVASAYECFRDDWGLIMINNASKKYGPKLEHSDIIKRSKLENIKRKCLSALRAFLVTLHNNLCKLDS